MRCRLAVHACALAALLLSVLAAAPARATLQREMESMFSSMTVAVPPAAFNTSRRGVLSGGGIDMRNRIVNERLVSFVPPSFEAGCGGIDFFAGSFSFISAEQFTQLMRAVAMNATGYAFQLALRGMCPDCMNTIETLQRKIQEFSQFFANSCQLAQGIVANGARAIGRQIESDASLVSNLKGVGDVFQSFTLSTGTSPVRQAADNAPAAVEQRILGNVVWRALRRQSVQTWYAFGNNDLLEVMMNVSGTVIIDGPAADNADAGENFQTRVLAPKPHLFETLVSGGTVTIEGCDDYDDNKCLQLVVKTVTIQGFQQMLIDSLLGTVGSPGVIRKLASNTALSTQEQRILQILPNGLGGLLVRLSAHSPEAGRVLAETAAPQLALAMARTVMLGLLSGVETAVGASDHPHTRQVMELISRSHEGIQSTALVLQGRYGSVVDTVRAYTDLLGVLPTTATGRAAVLPSAWGGR